MPSALQAGMQTYQQPVMQALVRRYELLIFMRI